MGTQRYNDVVSTSMRRDHVALTLIRRHFDVVCLLGLVFDLLRFDRLIVTLVGSLVFVVQETIGNNDNCFAILLLLLRKLFVTIVCCLVNIAQNMFGNICWRQCYCYSGNYL